MAVMSGLTGRRVGLILILLFVEMPTAVRATTGVAVANRQRIVLAADSLEGGVTKVCKLDIHGNTAVTLAGLMGSSKTFSAKGAAHRAAEQSTNAFQGMAAFRREAASKLASFVAANKSTEYFEAWTHGTPIVSAIFASFDFTGPKVEVCNFGIDPTGSVRTPVCEQWRGEDNAIHQWTIGHRDAIQAKLKPATWGPEAHADMPRFTKSLVDIEIADKPQYVGPPVSVLVLDSAGIRFVARGECAEGIGKIQPWAIGVGAFLVVGAAILLFRRTKSTHEED
jgi:hypothetical protein